MPEQAIPNIDSLSSPVKAFLWIFAFFASRPIQRRWCVEAKARQIFTDALKNLDGDASLPFSDLDVARVFDELATRGVATTNEHSIVLATEVLNKAITGIPKDQQRAWVERALRLVDLWTPENSDDATTWKLMAELEPHITRILEFAEAEGIPHPTGVLTGQKLGVYLFLVGNVSRAEQLMRRGLELNEKHFGPNHPNVAVDVNNLAYLLDETGRGAETEPLKIRVVEILMEHQEAEPEKFATALVNLAGIFRKQGRMSEAEKLYRQAIEFEERHLGSHHPTLARELRNLGALLGNSNRSSEAEDLLRRALAIDEKRLGANHPAVATDLQLLARILSELKKVEGLDRLHQRAVEINGQWFPVHSPEVLYGLIGLADSLERQGKPDQAADAYKRIIENCESHEPPDSFPLILSLFKIGTAATARNDFTKAVPPLQRALALAEAKFGRNDSQTGSIRQALIGALKGQGNFVEARAIALNQREEELRRKVEANPRDATALNEYGLFLKNERNDFAGAERSYRQAIECKPNDPLMLGNLAVLLTNVFGKHDEAEQLYRRALEIAPTDATILGNYASLVHNVRRRFDEAAQMYELALGENHRDPAIHANYAGLLITTGKTAEADSHIVQAWKEQAERHDRISARILFLKAVTETLAGLSADPYLGRLKQLFKMGVSHVIWSTEALLGVLNEKLKPVDAAFFSTIAKAIGDKSVVHDLESCERWQAVAEVAPNTPWETIITEL